MGSCISATEADHASDVAGVACERVDLLPCLEIYTVPLRGTYVNALC